MGCGTQGLHNEFGLNKKDIAEYVGCLCLKQELFELEADPANDSVVVFILVVATGTGIAISLAAKRRSLTGLVLYLTPAIIIFYPMCPESIGADRLRARAVFTRCSQFGAASLN